MSKHKNNSEFINDETSKKKIKIESSESLQQIKQDIKEINEAPNNKMRTTNDNVLETSKNAEMKPGTSKNLQINEITETSNQEDKTETNSVEGSTSSNEVLENKYMYNYWEQLEPKKECKLHDDERENLKINQLKLGTFEEQSLVIRITYKSEIKDTAKGKNVSFLGMDETGEISIYSFGKIALQIYNVWENNCVYSIANFNVYEENPDYPSGSGNKLQIKANPNFRFQKIENSTIPPINYNFISIQEIKSVRLNTRVDLLGVLTKDFGLRKIPNGTYIRELGITDNNKENIITTLWGRAAEKFKSIEKSVIAFRKGIVGEYQGNIKLNCTVGTYVWLNPKIPEASPLAKWFFRETNKRYISDKMETNPK